MVTAVVSPSEVAVIAPTVKAPEALASLAALVALTVTSTVVPPVTAIVPPDIAAVPSLFRFSVTFTAPVGALVPPPEPITIEPLAPEAPALVSVAVTVTLVPPRIAMSPEPEPFVSLVSVTVMEPVAREPLAPTEMSLPAVASVTVTFLPPRASISPVVPEMLRSVVLAALTLATSASVMFTVSKVLDSAPKSRAEPLTVEPEAPPRSSEARTLTVCTLVMVTPAGAVAKEPTTFRVMELVPRPPLMLSSGFRVVAPETLLTSATIVSSPSVPVEPAEPIRPGTVSIPVVSVKVWPTPPMVEGSRTSPTTSPR